MRKRAEKLEDSRLVFLLQQLVLEPLKKPISEDTWSMTVTNLALLPAIVLVEVPVSPSGDVAVVQVSAKLGFFSLSDLLEFGG